MLSFVNSLDLYGKTLSVPSIGIVKISKAFEILNNFAIHHSQSNFYQEENLSQLF